MLIIINIPTIVSFQDTVYNRPGNLVIYINLLALWSKNCVKCECFWWLRFIATWRRVDCNCATNFINLKTVNSTDRTSILILNTCTLFNTCSKYSCSLSAHHHFEFSTYLIKITSAYGDRDSISKHRLMQFTANCLTKLLVLSKLILHLFNF